MKVIGLLGGMSWESSVEYYRIINETVKAKLGGLHSAKCLLYSVDFAEIEALQHQGDWAQATEFMIDAAQRLERGGAEMLLICTNTMHKMADAVQDHLQIPLLHIADATARHIQQKHLKSVGLLGTKFTMEETFYRERLEATYGLHVLIPEEEERNEIHRVIYEELCQGEFKQASKDTFVDIIRRLATRGAEGIVLGCTEIPLLIQDSDSPLPLLNTTRIHAEAAVQDACDG